SRRRGRGHGPTQLPRRTEPIRRAASPARLSPAVPREAWPILLSAPAAWRGARRTGPVRAVPAALAAARGPAPAVAATSRATSRAAALPRPGSRPPAGTAPRAPTAARAGAPALRRRPPGPHAD